LENERYLEEKMTFDISSMLMSLTNMIARCDGAQTFRLRMKFCSLCVSLSTRTDTFILRKESPARQNIIELLMEWMEVAVHVRLSLSLSLSLSRGLVEWFFGGWIVGCDEGSADRRVQCGVFEDVCEVVG
jgi:hypothetical protein